MGGGENLSGNGESESGRADCRQRFESPADVETGAGFRKKGEKADDRSVG